MPDAGYRADIVVLQPPTTMARGEKREIRVRVRNASDVRWVTSGVDTSDVWRGDDDGKYQMFLGDHWVAADGEPVAHDDGRALLPILLEPGESTTLLLGVNAPLAVGDYVLELDLVQENVTWFAAKGSEKARYHVRIE
jgi:hypothetical protein